MTLAANLLLGEHEAEQVPGGGEEAGDMEQRVVRDTVAEQRAPLLRGHTTTYTLREYRELLPQISLKSHCRLECDPSLWPV